MTPGASRIAGRGGLLRSLRSLLGRVRRYGEHRASTADEQRWAALLFDGLTNTFGDAMTSDSARASLHAVDERRRISSKTAGRERAAAGETGRLIDGV